jgi:hypothetical protein
MSDAAEFAGREEIEVMVLAKVIEDAAFAVRLKADPKAVLSEMFETKLPASPNIHVFQEPPSDLMIRLPIVATDEISEKELEGVAGRACTPFFRPRPGPHRIGIRPVGPGGGPLVPPQKKW